MVDPYAHIAAFYEAEYGPHEADAAFFARRAVPGRLLVLGCGTGRVARRLAAAREVVGLDLSEPMLEVARARSPEVRYVQGDMRSFDLGRFAEILVPNAAFSFLPTRADQQRCLASCRRALEPGAPLTLDVPMPDLARWAEAHSPERPAWEGRVSGAEARRTRETRRSIARQRLELLDRYYVDGALVATSTLVLRLLLPGELEWMLESCGFYAEEILGDYAGRPLRDDSPRLLVRALAA